MKLTVYLAILCVITLAVLAFTEGKARKSSNRIRTSTSRRSSSSSSRRRKTSSSKTKAAIKAATIAFLASRRIKAITMFRKRRKPTDFDENVGESTLRVDSNGGKMEILREGQVLELNLKHISEKIANKTERIEYNLKKSNFKIERKSNISTQYGVRAGVMTVSGTLSNNASLNLTLFMFAESANITGEDGNQYELVEGGTKINLELDWPTEVEHLELKLSVKCGFDGKKGRKPTIDKIVRGKKGKNNARGPKTFSVCPNARMTYSPSYKRNGTNTEMPQNYPMPGEVSEDNESEVALRFNGRKIFYDPTVETGDDVGDDPFASSSGHMIVSSSASTLFMVATVLFSLLKFSF